MVKKILFVGDVRPSYNYGAIATTESMLELIDSLLLDFEINIIDSRSFLGNTPINGWPALEAFQKSDNILKKLTKKIGIYDSMKKIKDGRYKKQVTDNIPSRIDQYEYFAEKIQLGQTWSYERRLIEWSDMIIIQGEGNIVNGTDSTGRYRNGGRYILFFAYLSKMVFNKQTFIINHTVDPINRDIQKIIKMLYPNLDGASVREKKSLALLKEWGIDNVSYVPDALWTHDFYNDLMVKKPKCLQKFDFSDSYICLGDSSGIKNKYTQVKWDVVNVYTDLIIKLENVCPNIIFIDGYNGQNVEINKVIKDNNLKYVNLTNCNYHELFYVLQNASLFISGRWHASIISLLANTPILLWGSDSHKTEALYSEIDYPYEFFDVTGIPLNTDRIAKEAKKIMNENHDNVWRKVIELKELAYDNVSMLYS